MLASAILASTLFTAAMAASPSQDYHASNIMARFEHGWCGVHVYVNTRGNTLLRATVFDADQEQLVDSSAQASGSDDTNFKLTLRDKNKFMGHDLILWPYPNDQSKIQFIYGDKTWDSPDPKKELLDPNDSSRIVCKAGKMVGSKQDGGWYDMDCGFTC